MAGHATESRVETAKTGAPVPKAASVPFRIAHLTVYRDLPSGIRKQLRFEHTAAQAMPVDVQWTTLAVHGGEIKEPFERSIPAFFRSMFLRNFYGWLTVRKLIREHDAVLLRYMPFDLSAPLMAPLIRSRFTVHHSKEVEEMKLIKSGLSGRIASFFDRLIGPIVVGSGRGVIGVTREIADYENARISGNVLMGVYPNGVDPDVVPLVEDSRDPDCCSILFMSDRFSRWHGLDRLVDAVAAYEDDLSQTTFHLVGRLRPEQTAHIESLGEKGKVFVVHGYLEPDAYRRIVASADVGLGSLALDRQNMSEGSILKNRDMLGSGLSVYATHRDAGLPEDFAFFYRAAAVNVGELLAFCREAKAHGRAEVREAAIAHIDKGRVMLRLADWLRKQAP